jgi:ABC-type nitrate/sulfonate/bicarbonate transport system substrate-binding protein
MVNFFGFRRRCVFLALIVATALGGCRENRPSPGAPVGNTGATSPIVRLGISPYPDTGLPVMTEKLGLFKKNGVHADLKVLQWGEVMPALASGSVDVVIQNMNSFHEVCANLKAKDVDLVFERPLFVFRGGGLMVRGKSGMAPLADMLTRYPNRKEALRRTILQLRGKTLITTRGTDHEQMVLAALRLAGLRPNVDVKVKYAEPDNAVAAFVGGEGDGCTGGLVQRLAVQQRGGYVLFEMDDVAPPVINGFITTRKYAEQHRAELDRLAAAWFQTVQYIDGDPKGRSKPFLDYLAGQGSARFTPEQYVNVWRQGDVFPTTGKEAQRIFTSPDSKYYWKNSWSSIGKFLVETKKTSAAAPEAAYLAR